MYPRRSSLLLCSAFVCLVACPLARAQDAETPAPKPRQTHAAEDPVGVPPAVPARPTITNPAHIPLPGYLQFEQGFNFGDGSPGGNLHQSSIVQSTKLALTHHLMVSIADQPFARTLLDGSVSSSGNVTSQTDTGDLQLGVQALFTDVDEGYGREPTLAIGFQRTVRHGTAPDLDIGGNQQGITLYASGDLFGLHYDSNALFNEQTSVVSSAAGTHTVRRAQFGQTVAVTRQITKPFSVTVEVFHFTQPFVTASVAGAAVARANSVGLLVTPGYNLRDNLVLDGGFSRGLTSTSTQWQVFAGFTYLLPKRLFKEHRGGKFSRAGR